MPTDVYLTNNTPSKLTLSKTYEPAGKSKHRRGTVSVAIGERLEIESFDRDSGVTDGKIFYYEQIAQVPNPFGNDTKTIKLQQKLKGSLINSTMWQGVSGGKWYSDRHRHTQRYRAANGASFDVEFGAYKAVTDDDVDYAIRCKYPTNQSRAAHELNILAYNIYMRATWLFRNGQTIRCPLIVEAVAAVGLPLYDVIIFSEAFDNSIRKSLLTRLRNAGYRYATDVVGSDSGGITNGGVVIVSRWPILEYEERLFGTDDLADKGVMYARIDKKGQVYHIFGTHTQADADEADVRERQFALLSGFISRKIATRPNRSDEPVIIGGDLNVDRKNAYGTEYHDMLKQLGAKEATRKGPLKHTFDPQSNRLASSGAPEDPSTTCSTRRKGSSRPRRPARCVCLSRSKSGSSIQRSEHSTTSPTTTPCAPTWCSRTAPRSCRRSGKPGSAAA